MDTPLFFRTRVTFTNLLTHSLTHSSANPRSLCSQSTPRGAAQEELESGYPPLFSNESNIYSFTHSLTHSSANPRSLCSQSTPRGAAQEELESVHPPLLQTLAMFVSFYTIKLDSYLLLPQLSPNAAEGQLHRNRIAKPNHTSREICFIVTPFRDTKSNDKRKEISCGVSR